MIIILDDTFNERHKYSDVTYLSELGYSKVCNIYRKPTYKILRAISNNIKKYELLCNHRSLRLSNKLGEPANNEEANDNFYKQFAANGIPRIEFGRAMHTNYDLLKLDKNIFYDNLKSFLDHYINNGSIEIKILYYGSNYKEIQKLTDLEKLIDEVINNDIANFKDNEIIKRGIEMFITNRSPNEVIDEWIENGLTKKDIRIYLNKLI